MSDQNKSTEYTTIHRVERQILEAEPDLGLKDNLDDVTGWLTSFCAKSLGNDGWALSHSAVQGLARLLTGVRRRLQHLESELVKAAPQPPQSSEPSLGDYVYILSCSDPCLASHAVYRNVELAQEQLLDLLFGDPFWFEPFLDYQKKILRILRISDVDPAITISFYNSIASEVRRWSINGMRIN